MECLICFTDIDVDRTVKCGDPFCTAVICTDCTKSLIEFSHKDKTMPKCPNTRCKEYYLLEEIYKIKDQEIIKKYKECYIYELQQDKVTQIKKALENEDILKRLRQERKVFIDTHFPPAISKVANIVLKTKLKRIEKQLSEKIKDQLKKANKTCMNSFCDGHLDENYVCMVCSIKFCKDCDKELTIDHVCDPSDLQSKKLIDGMIKCPACGIPVEKSEGCNNMTCANCNTNFHYEDGTQGGGGNHGKNIQINLRKKIIFSTMYHDYLQKHDLLDTMIEIESKEPKKPSQTQLITALKKYYKNKNRDSQLFIKLRIPDEYNKYVKQIYKCKQYHHHMINIEKLLQKNSLKMSDLISIKNKINSQ